MKSKRKNYKIWFYSEKHLEDIATEFHNEKLIGEYYYDYENVYEWIEAQSIDSSFELNISREHSYWNDYEEGSAEQKAENLKEPITIMLMFDSKEPSDIIVEEIAKQINSILTCSVYLGTIKYLGGNNYEYIKTKEIIY